MATPEQPPRMAEKTWKVYTHEDGSQVIDLEVYYFGQREAAPIVGVYSLSPEEVARGLMAQKPQQEIRLREYISNLRELMDTSPLEEGTPLH